MSYIFCFCLYLSLIFYIQIHIENFENINCVYERKKKKNDVMILKEKQLDTYRAFENDLKKTKVNSQYSFDKYYRYKYKKENKINSNHTQPNDMIRTTPMPTST